MLIGVDGNEANVEKKVGISEYCFELLKQFKAVSSIRQAQDKFQIYLKERSRKELPKENKNWSYRIVQPGKLWTQIGLPFDLFTHKPRPDVFFSPSHYAPRFCPVPTVVSVMDLSFLYFPQLFKKSDLYQLKNWTKYSVKNASKVLTISKSSRDDIIKEYGIEPGRVLVTYPGIKQESRIMNQESRMEAIRKRYNIHGEYILFVGTLQPRKNIVRLIEAFSRLNKENVQLIVVGKKGWLYEDIFEAPKKYGVEDQVRFLEFVSDEDLAMLYKNAEFFVLPSLYEGFGLPILEAMQYECPVIASNISSLPEAGGAAAFYIDPKDTDDIAKKMAELLGNKKLREELVEKGRKQVKKFSWEKTARQTLDVLLKM